MKQLDEILQKSQVELQKFSDLVLKWQQHINLIAPSTINDIWKRHIVDSAQLFLLLPSHCRVLADMGSGGGFPAIVLAIVNKVLNGPVEQFYLIESDNKKSIFLREAARIFDLPVCVFNKRLENVYLENVDVVTARALSSVGELLRLGRGVIGIQTTCLFLKGEQVEEELKENPYQCIVEKIPSCTNQKSSVLKIGGIHYE